MPTGTFFRLSEEKRGRLIDAAWEEFTRVPYGDVSINRIIQAAGIPRGSFYQYFENKKEDLLAYMLEGVAQFFDDLFTHALQNAQGDVFAVILQAYDGLVFRRNEADENLIRCIKLFRLNPEVIMHNVISQGPDRFPLSIAAKVDTTGLRQRDEAFTRQVCSLLLFALGSAIIETLCDPDRREAIRQTLVTRVEIVRQGAVCTAT